LTKESKQSKGLIIECNNSDIIRAMKKIFVVLVALFAVFAFGCGKKTATPTATKTPGIQDLSNLDDSQKASVQRLEYTDPALYQYLQEASKKQAPTATATLLPNEQKKLNKKQRFSSAGKYEIKGTAEILDAQTLKIESFNYNNNCGLLSIALTRQDKPGEKIANLKDTNGCTGCTFTLSIPSNIRLSQFDSVSLFCPNIEDPISKASFTEF